MKKYTITPELVKYINQLQISKSYVEIFVVAINYALTHENQPLILSQSDLDEFLETAGIKM